MGVVRAAPTSLLFCLIWSEISNALGEHDLAKVVLKVVYILIGGHGFESRPFRHFTTGLSKGFLSRRSKHWGHGFESRPFRH